MNHRIRKIAEQVGYKPVQGADFFNSIEDIFHQKFAEAIIRECVWQVVKDDAIPQDIQILIGNRFKEHFGVKE